MGKLFLHSTTLAELYQAWRKIRENGVASDAEDTRIAVETFEKQANRNISQIQRRLRSGEFQFEPQIGVLKKKESGGYRGIVMASVCNRIVERAWLNALQSQSKFVKGIITLPTSVGGVPERSVPHGLKLIKDAMSSGKKFFVRSDISGFFDAVPRDVVIARLAEHVHDDKFMGVLTAATKVTLANEEALGEERKVFPVDMQGVAQGSPLSPLFGNILLNEFDLKFNKLGVTCVRFIDDFVLLADEERKARKAFENASLFLSGLGLRCHDPFIGKTNIEKAEHGRTEEGFVFLGYDIRPGLFQPSAKARQKLQKAIDGRIYAGKKAIADLRSDNEGGDNTLRYAQTLVGIDRIVRGWGTAFAYGNATSTIEQLDEQIDTKLNGFRNWYSEQIRNCDWKMKRRMGGVCLLTDIKAKSLDDVPFKLEPGQRFVQSGKTLTISTDGAVITFGRRNGKDRGAGGWAFVVHETGQEVSGSCLDVTNNQMELTAVIEAIRQTPDEKSLRIRTDSQYVVSIINGGNVVKSNADLWKQYRDVSISRKIKVEWVKGHSGDKHNDRADALAHSQAQSARRDQNVVAREKKAA